MAWLPSQFAGWAQPAAAQAPVSAPPAWYDPASWGGALSGIGDGLGRNSGMLLGLGAGLLSGNLGEIPQAISQGASADRARNLQNYQLALQAQGRQAAAQWATSIGHPEWAAAAASGGLDIPTMFAATRPIAVPDNGYLANQNTGLPVSMSGSAQAPAGNSPASAGGGPPSALMGNGVYRQMTPEERKNLGVGPNDPYVINNATGKPVYVGNPTSVNINNQGESAYAKKRGEDIAGNMKDIQNAGLQAYGTIGQLSLLQQALQGTYQGAGGQTVQKLKKLAQAVGINVQGVADGDLANSISNGLALQLRNPAGGAGMPGSLSDSDRQFLTTMVPGLTNTPQGNALMIEAAKRVQQRNIDVAKLATQYAQQHNGQLDDNFFAGLQQYSDTHPLFDDLIKAMPQSGAPAAPAAPAPAPSAGPSQAPQPGVPTNADESKVVDGVTYWRVGPDWYTAGSSPSTDHSKDSSQIDDATRRKIEDIMYGYSTGRSSAKDVQTQLLPFGFKANLRQRRFGSQYELQPLQDGPYEYIDGSLPLPNGPTRVG